MTTMAQPNRHNLDLPSMDDEMEMVTSPYRQADDIDLDLDPMHDSVDKDLLDEADHTNDDLDPMQADTEPTYQDDDMVDDDFEDQAHGSVNQDLNMEAYQENSLEDQDEDFMFDEETEGTTMRYGSTDDVESSISAMPVDREHSQVHIDTGTITQAIHTEQDQDQQRDREDNQLYERYEEINTKATIPKETTSTEHETSEDQAHLGPEITAETYIIDTVIDNTSDQLAESKVLAGSEQLDEELLTQTNDIVEEEMKRSQALEAGLQGELPTDIPNSVQVIEAEQSSVSGVSYPGLNEDEATVNEPTHDLHSVMVTYLGQEMSLFPPSLGDSSATFFLADPTLAYDPFDKLLVACRGLLGESLEHDDELVFDIPTLGLHISEDSKYSSEIGLAQVLEVYLALSRNEQINTPEPLYCHLSSRVCLSSQYSYLASSAREGKCYTEIAEDYAESPKEAEVFDEVSEHQHAEDDEHDSQDKTVDPEQEVATGPSSKGLESEVQPEVGIADLHVKPNEETVPPPPNAVDDATNVNNIAETEPPQADEAGISSIETEGPHKDHTEQGDSATSTGRESQILSEEQYGYATNDENPSQTIDIVQDPLTEQQSGAQTPSSHTVEADYADSRQDVADEEASLDQVEPLDAEATVTQADDDNTTTYIQDDIEYSDEELFNDDEDDDIAVATKDPAKNDNAEEAEEDLFAPQSNGQVDQTDVSTDENIPHENKTVTTSAGQTDQHLAELKSSNNLVKQADDFLHFEEVGFVPVTPSKSNGNKRKVLEDDDDLAFLDVDTPEPKRRRSS